MTANTDVKQTLQTLPVNQLETNPFQPRDKIKTEDIQELADSIKEHGVIEPLVVAQTPAGYQIIAGERRWRASKLAGLKEVPVSIIKTTPKQMLELALVENVQRKDLNAIERANGFQQLIREFGMSASDVARKVSKSPTYVTNSLKLLTLPDLIKDAVIRSQISEGHARAICSLSTESEQIECFRRIVEGKSSVRETESLVREKKEESLQVPVYLKKPTASQKNEQLEKIKKSLSEALKASISLSLRRSNQQTRLTITLKGDERETDASLKKIIGLLDKS